MMPSIKDIAKAAGVSHGTVSNVLNGKGNVSLEKIRLIEETAKKMGYRINYRAKSLRAGNSNAVSLILPNITSEHYSELYIGVEKTLSSLGLTTVLHTSEDIQDNELRMLQEITSDQSSAIIAVSCLDDARKYYEATNIPADKIVFVYRKPKNAVHFAGFDYNQAGGELAEAIHQQGYKSAGLFTGPDIFSSEQAFADSFIESLSSFDVNVKVRKISVPNANAYSKAFEFFDGDIPEVIVTSDLLRADYVKSAAYLGSSTKAPPIYSLSSSTFLVGDTVQKYYLNDRLLGKHVAESLVNKIRNKQEMDKELFVDNRGWMFRSEMHEDHGDRVGTLTMLTLPSPSTRALKKLLPHFKKTTGIDVRLAVHSFDEIYDILTDIENNQHYDIIRMDMASLPWFAHSTLKPLNELDPSLLSIIDEIQHWDKYSLVGGTPYAIPFDPSIQLLFYRKDLFEDTAIKRMYYEKYRDELEVPQDFASFNLVSRFFTQTLNAESPVQYGHSMTYGMTEIVAADYLMRYYSEGGRLIYDESYPILDEAIAVSALSKYIEAFDFAETLSADWWEDSIASFAEGRTAMVILFMNHFYKMANYRSLSSNVGFAPVPGKKPLLGGGVLGISKYSEKTDEASRFFQWVYSDEIAEQITLLGGISAKNSIYNNQAILDTYPWLSTAQKSSLSGIRETSLPSGQFFNYRMVEKIIGRGVKNVINQIMTREQAVRYINHSLADMELL